MASHQSRLLEAERKRCSFDLQELKHYQYGGEKHYKLAKKIEDIVLHDPILRQDDMHFRSFQQDYERGLQRSRRAVQLLRELKLEYNSSLATHFWRTVESESLPISLNLSMFEHALRTQGDAEQSAYWVPLARDFRIIGCYAQTELGHGSFVRGLETRAEYDRTTEEFILNTPTLTGMKWWPGSMGKTATHALVMARLFLAGSDRGMHMFIVPLRHPDTHEPLPGVTVGNIGPKLGYNPVDNGFLSFSKFRVPRVNKLMRHSEVTPDGRLVSHTQAKKASYGTMLFIRSHMVSGQGRRLSQAITIAMRYSAVRQQGFIGPGETGAETAVLDYVSQQYLLFPVLASAFAFQHVGKAMAKTFTQLDPKNAELVQELHASSSCLKALTAFIAVKGVETCRHACGGHGYSRFSGLPHIYEFGAAAEIYEGDALVLYLQGARYLMKAMRTVQSGGVLKGSIKYLSHWLSTAPGSSPITTGVDTLADLFVLSNIFECAAARMVSIAADKLNFFLSQPDLSPTQAWNKAAPWLIRASEAHGEALLAIGFASIVDVKLSRPLRRLMKTCALLYSLWRVEQNTMFFLETGTITPADVQTIHGLVMEQLAILRPDVVSLVDGFDLPDALLQSALGAQDGDVYTRLYDFAKREPLNKTEVADGIHEFLKPLMKSRI